MIKPSNMLMRYLICGISTVLLMIGCAKKDAQVTIEWLVNNHSTHTIEVKSRGFNDFSLLPNDQFYFKEESIGPEDMGKDNIEPVYRPSDRIIIDGIEYASGVNRTITAIDNFDCEKVEYNHFKLTYTFTDEVIAELGK